MTLALTFVFEARVKVGEAVVVGSHRMIPITGGTFEGPQLRGVVMPGGADWQCVRADGTLELEARYALQTEAGERIAVVNRGLRVMEPEVAERIARGECVSPGEYYFRAAPTFQVDSANLEWMTRRLFISTGERQRDLVVIRVWVVD